MDVHLIDTRWRLYIIAVAGYQKSEDRKRADSINALHWQIV